MVIALVLVAFIVACLALLIAVLIFTRNRRCRGKIDAILFITMHNNIILKS